MARAVAKSPAFPAVPPAKKELPSWVSPQINPSRAAGRFAIFASYRWPHSVAAIRGRSSAMGLNIASRS